MRSLTPEPALERCLPIRWANDGGTAGAVRTTVRSPKEQCVNLCAAHRLMVALIINEQETSQDRFFSPGRLGTVINVCPSSARRLITSGHGKEQNSTLDSTKCLQLLIRGLEKASVGLKNRCISSISSKKTEVWLNHGTFEKYDEDEDVLEWLCLLGFSPSPWQQDSWKNGRVRIPLSPPVFLLHILSRVRFHVRFYFST